MIILWCAIQSYEMMVKDRVRMRKKTCFIARACLHEGMQD